MNNLNQGQNQGLPQTAPVQEPPVLPAPLQAQPVPPQPSAPLLPPPPPPVVPVLPPLATSPLDSTKKFDGQPNKIRIFLAHVEDSAQQFNWQSILTILVALSPMSYNLVLNYGWMSLKDIQAKVITYVRMHGCEAQDSYMLYIFLIESLTDFFKAQVLLYKQDYTITTMGGQPAMKDGPKLLKRIIMFTYIDNKASTAHIRETIIDTTYQLTNLEGDITAFNNCVSEQVCQLAARGTSAADLLTYLWKTYLLAPDAEFKRYIKTLKVEYEDK